MFSCSFCKTHHNQVPSPSHRANVSSNSGSVACPPLPQVTPTPEERCFQEESVLQCQADPRPGSQTGPSLVADRGDKVEWQTNATQPSRPNSGIGCLNVRVGSQYVGVSDRRLVVLDREKSPHKYPGNVGRDIRNQDLCQGPLEHTHLSQDGQHLSSGICESHGRDTISQTVGCCQGSVDMVPQQGDDCISRVSPRRAEHHSRFLLKIHHGISGMEAGSLCLQASSKKVCTNTSGPLCNKDQYPAGTVYFLETRSFHNGSGRVDDSLDKSPRLRLPSLLPLGEVSAEDCQRAGNNRSYRPCMGPPALVPCRLDALVENPVLLPLSDSLLLDPFNQPMLSSSPPGWSPEKIHFDRSFGTGY